MAENQPDVEGRVAAVRVGGGNGQGAYTTMQGVTQAAFKEYTVGKKLLLFVDIDHRATDGVVVITRSRAQAGLPPCSGRMAGVFLDPTTGRTAPIVVEQRQGSEGLQRHASNAVLTLSLTLPRDLQSAAEERVIPFPSPLGPASTGADGLDLLTHRGGVDGGSGETFSSGDLFIDFETYEVMVRGTKVDFPFTTTKLLFFFVRHPRKVYTREQLLNHVWGCNVYVSPRNVDLHVSRIRRAIEENPAKPTYIQSVKGVGYKFNRPGV